MMILLTGGSKSGKSSLAEKLLLRLGKEASAMVYLATMQVVDSEDRAIVRRHRQARFGKGFKVIEQARSLDTVTLPANAVLLLEDIPNLLANEIFGGGGFTRALKGIRHLRKNCLHLILVTNEVGSDGFPYAEETLQYIDELGRLNRQLAGLADSVAEVVLGLPQILKGELP